MKLTAPRCRKGPCDLRVLGLHNEGKQRYFTVVIKKDLPLARGAGRPPCVRFGCQFVKELVDTEAAQTSRRHRKVLVVLTLGVPCDSSGLYHGCDGAGTVWHGPTDTTCRYEFRVKNFSH